MATVNQERISELIALAKVEDSKLFSSLLSALKHEEKSIVIGASLLLGRLADERAAPSLIRAFLTTDPQVGASVAWALGQCGSKAAAPFLSKAIQKGFVVANSCEALGRIGDESALPILFGVLNSDQADVRACAIKALGGLAVFCHSQKAEIIENVLPLTRDKSRKVRISAGIILERIAHANKGE